MQPRGSTAASRRLWGGTFHAIATRLLRRHGKSIGLAPEFTILDRSDSEDLVHVVRQELKLAEGETRFPLKGTCLSIYSRSVNAQIPLRKVLDESFPWCLEHETKLKQLFRTYVDRKEELAVLDYDDLLLFWRALAQDETAGTKLRAMFDCVLVDEYQDTNIVQAEILKGLCPDGDGLTIVGDDAQSIYGFRAATVRNILDFPKQYPGTTVIKLEQNYRSTQPILAATNEVIAAARETTRERPVVVARAGGAATTGACARTRTSRLNTWSNGFSNIGKTALPSRSRPYCSGRRITVLRWRWNWADGISRSINSAD